MRHIQTYDLGGKRKHVAALNPFHHLGNPLGGDDPAGSGIQLPLDPLDLVEHAVILQCRILAAVLRHESERSSIRGPAQSRTEILNQASALAVTDPLAEVVQPRGIALALTAA